MVSQSGPYWSGCDSPSSAASCSSVYLILRKSSLQKRNTLHNFLQNNALVTENASLLSLHHWLFTMGIGNSKEWPWCSEDDMYVPAIYILLGDMTACIPFLKANYCFVCYLLCHCIFQLLFLVLSKLPQLGVLIALLKDDPLKDDLLLLLCLCHLGLFE